MLRKHATFVLAALAFCVVAPAVRADATSEARRQLQAAYNAENAAAAKKDAKAMLAHLAPDFQVTTAQGQKMTLEQYRAVLPQMLTVMRDIKAVSKIRKLMLQGKEARVTVDERMQATVMAPTPGQAATKPAKLVVTSTSEDTWVKSTKGWLRKSSHTVKQVQTVNGKPVPGG